ncbi:CDP-alcohol phosphatidyltransferase family protein [Sphingomonas bacterium]|uniref:CDP-alcohol phosphatidyltransferase family protein n=1 Tax=Sphingomonas bacterium TaxID=1895847 RepID=UPI001576F4BD|nr:CDP-alcohol phosphatidyltransferase family protein [Sphingomonas bacterium]
MTAPPPDGSRDRRIEDPTNLWLIHPAARALLAPAVAAGISANAVSLAGLALGIGAALCYAHWTSAVEVLLGFALSVAWLIADGLDGMVARATGTASPLGRFLDGLCDHGVFILIYVAMALSIGTGEGWMLAVLAGAAHIGQSSLYEGERARFHRRVRGVAAPTPVYPSADAPLLMRGYDRLAGAPDRLGLPFERLLARQPRPLVLATRYARRAVPAMRVQSLLSANVRVALIAIACLAGNPRIFWWAEIVALSAVTAVGLALHRRVEHGLVSSTSPIRGGDGFSPALPTRDR